MPRFQLCISKLLKNAWECPVSSYGYFQFSVISDGESSFHRGSFCWFLFLFCCYCEICGQCVLQLSAQVGEKGTQAVLFKGVFKRNSSP